MDYQSRIPRKGVPSCAHKGRKVVCRGMCGPCYTKELALTGAIVNDGLCSICRVNPRLSLTGKSTSAYCKECANARSLARNQKDLAHFREMQSRGRLKYRYGLSLDQRKEMFVAQGGKCLICGLELSLVPKALNMAAVDHNHQTDFVRALLCRGCNTGIGAMRDSPETLRAAADYLEVFRDVE